MAQGIFAALYGSVPAEFESAYPLGESVSRLAAVSTNEMFVATESLWGKVYAAEVVLEHGIPFRRNSFKPVFRGKFEEKDGKTVLRGAFAMKEAARFGISLGFAVGVVVAVASLVVPHFRPFSAAWIFLLAGIVLVLLCMAFVSLGSWASRNDVAWLSAAIAKPLSAP